MKAQLCILAALALLLGMSACNKQQSSEWIPEEQMASEGLLACSGMLDQFDAFDTETASEGELERAMDQARNSYERCKRQFEDAAKNQAERAFAAHRTAQIYVYELLFEAALSRRFDGMKGFCVIMRDIMKVIATDLENLQHTANTVSLDDEEKRQLAKLYQIDLQTVQILDVQMRLSCDGVPAGQLRKNREERRKEVQKHIQEALQKESRKP